MWKSTFTVLLGLFLYNASLMQAGLPFPGAITGGRPAGPGTAAVDYPTQAESAGTVDVDSLQSLADSLAGAADSLAALVDSLASQGDRVAGPEPEEKDKVEEENPWSGNFGMGLTLNRGNSEQRSLVSNLRVNRTGDKSRFTSSTTIANSKGDQGEATNKGSFKSKYELDRSKRFFYFATLDMYYNRQAGLNLRVAPGMGVGMAIIAQKKCRLNLNLGANPITEYRRDRPRRTHGHFLGSQDFRIDLNSRSRLEQSMTYKPRFDRVQEYLLTFEFSLTSQLTSAFDLKLNFECTYNSRPPEHDPPYKRQDWMFYTAISYNIW